MMGFGGMDMAAPWLFGVITVAAIWVGVWWILTTMGMTARRSNHNPPPAPPTPQLPPATWQQPRFTAPEGPPPPGQPTTRPTPTPVQAESDYR